MTLVQTFVQCCLAGMGMSMLVSVLGAMCGVIRHSSEILKPDE